MNNRYHISSRLNNFVWNFFCSPASDERVTEYNMIFYMKKKVNVYLCTGISDDSSKLEIKMRFIQLMNIFTFAMKSESDKSQVKYSLRYLILFQSP